MTPCILVLNGPNLNLLGTREPATYGHETLADISRLCADTAAEHGLKIEFRQTNHEGELLDWIHAARGRCAGILINPAAWTHTSVAIRDALVASELPVMEVLTELPLLHLRPEHRSRWFDWEGLFRALGIASLPTPGALRFDNYTLLIQAAIAGQGVAIGWRHLVDELLAQGLLCRLGEAEAHSARGYYLVLPERKRRQRLTARFVDWLQAELDSPAATV